MTNCAAQIFGLFELDSSGTVMYSKIDSPTADSDAAAKMLGRNFFDAIAASENGAEIQRRFRYFARGSEPAEKFTLTYVCDQQAVEVKVMLTQISHREYDEREKLIIVDIRKTGGSR